MGQIVAAAFPIKSSSEPLLKRQAGQGRGNHFLAPVGGLPEVAATYCHDDVDCAEPRPLESPRGGLAVVAGVHYFACDVCLGFHFGLRALIDPAERGEGPELEVASATCEAGNHGYQSKPEGLMT